MRRLKYGVEIEFNGVNRSTIAGVLTAADIKAEDEDYNHDTRDYWKLVGDGSVRHEGNELVSPILNKERLPELKTVLKLLRENGATVDRSCGIHIHHDVSDYILANFKSLFNFMYYYKDLFSAMMPRSRREGTYCASLTADELESLQRCTRISDINNVFDTRYKTVNFCSYSAYGTIEFRQHSGSLNYKKISKWIQLTNKILEHCRETNVPLRQIPTTTIAEQLEELRNELGISGTKLSDYIGERINQIAENEAQRTAARETRQNQSNNNFIADDERTTDEVYADEVDTIDDNATA